MEMTKNGAFVELSDNEMMNVDGGITFLTACAAVAGVCAAVAGCYKAGAAIGKFIKNLS